MPKRHTTRGVNPSHRARKHRGSSARDELQHFRSESAGWKLTAFIISKLPDILRESRALAPVVGSLVTAYVLAVQLLQRLNGT